MFPLLVCLLGVAYVFESILKVFYSPYLVWVSEGFFDGRVIDIKGHLVRHWKTHRSEHVKKSCQRNEGLVPLMGNTRLTRENSLPD
jgi:hypothetical protein